MAASVSLVALTNMTAPSTAVFDEKSPEKTTVVTSFVVVAFTSTSRPADTTARSSMLAVGEALQEDEVEEAADGGLGCGQGIRGPAQHRGVASVMDHVDRLDGIDQHVLAVQGAGSGPEFGGALVDAGALSDTGAGCVVAEQQIDGTAQSGAAAGPAGVDEAGADLVLVQDAAGEAGGRSVDRGFNDGLIIADVVGGGRRRQAVGGADAR